MLSKVAKQIPIFWNYDTFSISRETNFDERNLWVEEKNVESLETEAITIFF